MKWMIDGENAVKDIAIRGLQSAIEISSTLVHLRKEHAKAILKLLKEHETTTWEHLWDVPDGTFKGRCKNCGFVHLFIEGHDTQYKFCPGCGRSVTGNERIAEIKTDSVNQRKTY